MGTKDKKGTNLLIVFLLLIPFATLSHTKSSDYDVIVVGSGFGGSIAAYNLSQAGINTLVLERGRWWEVEDPTINNTFATLDSVLASSDNRSSWLSDTCNGNFYVDIFLPTVCSPTTGVLEFVDEMPNLYDKSPAISIEGVTVAVGSGVGGGSLVYNGISFAPIKEAWDIAFPINELPYMQMVWKDLVRNGHFDQVLSVIAPSPIPQDILHSSFYEGSLLMLNFAISAGYPLEDGSKETQLHGSSLVPLAIDWNAVDDEITGLRAPATILGEYMWGINSDAKHSLEKDDNYLGMALASGYVELKALHTVTEIQYDQRTRLFLIDVVHTDEDYNVIENLKLSTPNLILSAGSIGTTKLMVKARDSGNLPRLNQHVGTRWSTNGDMGSFRFVKEGVVGQGGPGAVKITNYDDKNNPIVLENISQRVPAVFEYIPELSPFLGAQLNIGIGIPDGSGTFTYDRINDTVILDWPKGASSNVYNRFTEVMKELPGVPLILSEDLSSSVTYHPLGGMPLGLATNLFCEVRGYKNLFAVDGSIIPGSAAATNPSILIAALAQRCMKKIPTQIANNLKQNRVH